MVQKFNIETQAYGAGLQLRAIRVSDRFPGFPITIRSIRNIVRRATFSSLAAISDHRGDRYNFWHSAGSGVIYFWPPTGGRVLF